MTLPWRRSNPREDNLRPGMAQRACGYTVGDRILATSEPRVRMDIQTAVQIASLSDQPLGLVELLTESAPVHLDPLGGPAVSVLDQKISSVVTTGSRWRDRLAARVRIARQARSMYPDFERRAANREQARREQRLYRVLGWVSVILTVVILVVLALIVRNVAQWVEQS